MLWLAGSCNAPARWLVGLWYVACVPQFFRTCIACIKVDVTVFDQFPLAEDLTAIAVATHRLVGSSQKHKA